VAIQSSNTVVIIRPHKFTPNPETEKDNNFQDVEKSKNLENEVIAKAAYSEVTNVIDKLSKNGINVKVFEDDGQWKTPDSVFPNNWFSTHSRKRMALYPMYTINRRLERREDIITSVIKDFAMQKVLDLSKYEEQEMYLEGTGTMVLDRINDIAYVAESKRSNRAVLEHFCKEFEYTSVIFTATDNDNIPIYHTNVMMGIGTGYVLICLESLRKNAERDAVISSFKTSGHEIIPLTINQVNNFAGNVLELDNGHEKLLVMSSTGYKTLEAGQVEAIQKYAKILTCDIPTIELAGGSIRCMLAEIFPQ
jgi:hypothetical protein